MKELGKRFLFEATNIIALHGVFGSTLELIERLVREAERRGVEFLVIGGQAVVHHGYERLTMDGDLLSEEGAKEEWRSI